MLNRIKEQMITAIVASVIVAITIPAVVWAWSALYGFLTGGSLIKSLGGVVAVQVSETSQIRLDKIQPGMIIPFVGTLRAAESLIDVGWEICDGRHITSSVALPRYQHQRTPDLRGRFLKGSADEKVLVQSGSMISTTSKDGDHRHSMPNEWYDRGFDGGEFNAIDRGHHTVKVAKVELDGSHHHTVSIEPPALSVIYLMRVR